jgi:opacity protein-like surface antigen
MKMRNVSVFAALLLGMASSVMAQDAAGDVAGGDMGAAPADTTAAPTDGATTDTAAPTEDAAPADGGDKKISLGLLLGYGISLESGGNIWGLGFGVRGGYNIDKIFLGARFVYYLGESPVSSWELGIEGGYDLSIGDKLTLRPGLGLGIASVTVSIPSIVIAGTTVGGGSGSSSELYIAPGASILYDVSDTMFLGAEARLDLILSSPMTKGFILLVNGGMRF